MAVIFYGKGQLSSGFVGYRAATTLGENGQYVQKWFSLNDYSPAEAARLAHATNAQWREKAESVVASKKQDFKSWKSIEDVPGLWGQISVERKKREHKFSHYATPMFITQLGPRAKAFRITPATRDYVEAWEQACEAYVAYRDLPEGCYEHLMEIMPDPSLFYGRLYRDTPRVSQIISKQALIAKLSY